jgi:hypothetical protein
MQGQIAHWKCSSSIDKYFWEEVDIIDENDIMLDIIGYFNLDVLD